MKGYIRLERQEQYKGGMWKGKEGIYAEWKVGEGKERRNEFEGKEGIKMEEAAKN